MFTWLGLKVVMLEQTPLAFGFLEQRTAYWPRIVRHSEQGRMWEVAGNPPQAQLSKASSSSQSRRKPRCAIRTKHETTREQGNAGN